MSVMMFLLVGFCIFAEAAREICFKFAADGSDFLHNITKPMVWLGIFFWAVELIAWVEVLGHVPLSIAFPLMALSYVAVVLGGAVFFGEQINRRHAAGALLITIGVACVGATGI